MSLSLPAPWDAFRRRMPITESYAYFDHASVSPLPEPTTSALRAWCDEASLQGVTVWDVWSRRVEATRRTAARLINATPDEIAFVPSTTYGITLVAEGFPWQPGDNVVLPAQEFPSNQYPWLNLQSRGVEARRVPTIDERLKIDEVRQACDSRTRLIAVSWVGYGTGWRNDLAALAEFAHERGILLFLDAIQGLGVLAMDVQTLPIDFLAADGHKWLLAPEGAGLFYVRREHLDRLRPIGVGWNSVRHSGDFQRIQLDLRTSACRYEGGSMNMAGLIALGASLNLLLEQPCTAREARMIEVTDSICEQLARHGATVASDRSRERASGIVSFAIGDRDPQFIKKHCLERQVLVNARMGRVRLSPHLYTSQDDIDRLLAALAELDA